MWIAWFLAASLGSVIVSFEAEISPACYYLPDPLHVPFNGTHMHTVELGKLHKTQLGRKKAEMKKIYKILWPWVPSYLVHHLHGNHSPKFFHQMCFVKGGSSETLAGV